MIIIFSRCPVQPIPNNRPNLQVKFAGVHFPHINNISFYTDTYTRPPLLQDKRNGDLPPNQNFGPNTYNISGGDVVQLIINNQVCVCVCVCVWIGVLRLEVEWASQDSLSGNFAFDPEWARSLYIGTQGFYLLRIPEITQYTFMVIGFG